MNTKLFSEAMSEVNDKYYEEAANYHCKKHGWVKFTSLAACAAIVLAVSFATLWKLPSQTTPQPEYAICCTRGYRIKKTKKLAYNLSHSI